MHPDLLNILSNQELPIENEKLIAYLKGELSAGEAQEVEATMADAGLNRDALEGLLMMADKRRLKTIEDDMSLFLRETLKQPHTKRQKRYKLPLHWVLLATGALLVLVILLWFYLHFLSRS